MFHGKIMNKIHCTNILMLWILELIFAKYAALIPNMPSVFSNWL